jgi:hypothetical protein
MGEFDREIVTRIKNACKGVANLTNQDFADCFAKSKSNFEKQLREKDRFITYDMLRELPNRMRQKSESNYEVICKDYKECAHLAAAEIIKIVIETNQQVRETCDLRDREISKLKFTQLLAFVSDTEKLQAILLSRPINLQIVVPQTMLREAVILTEQYVETTGFEVTKSVEIYTRDYEFFIDAIAGKNAAGEFVAYVIDNESSAIPMTEIGTTLMLDSLKALETEKPAYMGFKTSKARAVQKMFANGAQFSSQLERLICNCVLDYEEATCTHDSSSDFVNQLKTLESELMPVIKNELGLDEASVFRNTIEFFVLKNQ